MKTVCGKVVSSHPISLSRAAKYLSNFTASPNESSPAFSAYLTRTSLAFNQLLELRKHRNVPIGRDSRATCVAIVGKRKRKTRNDDDVNVDEHSRYDSPSVGMDLKVLYGGRIVEGVVSDVHSDLNKSNKKTKKKKKSTIKDDGDARSKLKVT